MDKNESLRHYLEILVQNGVEVFFPIDLVKKTEAVGDFIRVVFFGMVI